MAEWLYEDGIGERRAALVEEGRIVAARIEIDGDDYRLGEIATGRVTALAPARRRARVALERGEVSLEPVPSGVNEGARVTVEIVREAIPEAGRTKLPRAIVSDRAPTPAPPLLDQLAPRQKPGSRATNDTASGPELRLSPGYGSEAGIRHLHTHEPDALEAAGWSELLDEALTGEITFIGGNLRMSPTPAMTLFDVDGDLPPEQLALAAATAVAQAILRHDIGGSIGIDFPTLAGKAARQAIGEAIDAAMPPPFERTALNGFGFLQLVRPRPRASLPELLRADPLGAAARAALRTIERVPAGTPNAHRLPPLIRARIERDYLAELVRRTGRIPIFDA